jgi:hypothetical protein
MNFAEFFRLNEIADFAGRDTSGVDIQGKHSYDDMSRAHMDCYNENPDATPHELDRCLEEKLRSVKHSSFSRTFKVNDGSFKVQIQNYTDIAVNTEFGRAMAGAGMSDSDLRNVLKNVYYLAFEGPSGYSTTGANKGATEVYSQVLMTVKKFSEEHQLDGLAFTPYEPGMGLVYNRFIKNFTDFQMVDKNNGLYLSKKLLDGIIQKWPVMANIIANTQQDHADELRRTRDKKFQHRNEAGIARGMIGKMVVFDNYSAEKRIGLAYGYERGQLNLYYLSNYGVDYGSVPLSNVYRLRDNPQLKDEADEMIAAIQDGRRDSFSRAARLAQVVGDHQPYDGPLPSDPKPAAQPAPAPPPANAQPSPAAPVSARPISSQSPPSIFDDEPAPAAPVRRGKWPLR